MSFFQLNRDLSRAGVFHRPPTLKNDLYNGPTGVLSTLTTVASTLYVMPFEVGRSTYIDRIVAEVTTLAASSVIRLGAYSSDADGLPGNLVFETATIASDSTGVKESTVAVKLPEGRVWLALVAQGGTPIVRSFTSLNESPAPRTDAIINGNRVGLSQTGVTAALPSVFTGTVVIANGPAHLVRV